MLTEKTKQYFYQNADPASNEFDPHALVLKASLIDTPLGQMLAIADNDELHLLKFSNQRNLKQQVEMLHLKTNKAIITGVSEVIIAIERRPKAYFDGILRQFKRLYTSQAALPKTHLARIDAYPQPDPKLSSASPCFEKNACRAVANAANRISIVVPCHRIVSSSGNFLGRMAVALIAKNG